MSIMTGFCHCHCQVIRLAGAITTWKKAMGKGFDAVAPGRALIFDPSLVNNLHSHATEKSGCIRCNQCVATMYTPGATSCVLHAPNDARLNAVGDRDATVRLIS
jgi:hypothetical protein